ncbi:exopolysaccharide biosynthesis protein [Caloramator sp. E03]|uniref:tyrosine-protein phosphatase n=1 Tax=Caloramator sp. E03 TaxID=2576307 RepID=UPI0011101964|nr:CpsB/CapC family capsule biosynthesis tyrosine phosphatase [Caloramator sp. E03]QCX34368.1 exopolysaccharide biosynthesis protein [Caloramator sp. E03]
MIDVHCHIIPNIDDGSDSIETSLEMLKIASKDGIKKIIATPHFYPDIFENNPETILNSVENLNNISKELGIDIEVLCGQEVFLNRNLLKQYKDNKILTLNKSRYMLIELPMDSMPDYTFDIIYELALLGIVPIIAHPERYRYIINKPCFINNFIKEGCLIQINSSSITGLFGRHVKKTAIKLIKHNICHFIASDAHSNNIRIPALKKSLEVAQKYNNEIVLNITQNGNNLLKDETIEHNSEILSENKRIFWFKKKL